MLQVRDSQVGLAYDCTTMNQPSRSSMLSELVKYTFIRVMSKHTWLE